MEKIGDIREIPGEVVFEWEIKDFFSLSVENDAYYDSPQFYFSGASWEMRIYPNGHTQNKSKGWISLYVMRTSTGSSIKLNYSFGVKDINGKTKFKINFTRWFHERKFQVEISHFIRKEDLISIKSRVAPSNVLTLICTMKNSEPNAVARSLFRRQQDVCDNLREILLKAKQSDFKLKFNEGTIPAHQIILETRCPVFAAMFNHDTKEKQAGEVRIKDIERNTMINLLLQVYSGDTNNPTAENVLSLYAAAEKYDIKDIKEICLEFIHRNLSAEWVCDVIKFAELYQEEELGRRARDFFKAHANEVLESENWQIFVEENHDLYVELLESLVSGLLLKRKK